MGPDETEPQPASAIEAPSEATADGDQRSELERERDELKAIAQRTQADFVNYKRRVDGERTLIARSATGNVLVRLFPLIDDLQRAVESLPEDAPASWAEGVSLILANMRTLVEAEGASAFEPAPGEVFDPAQHEAVYYEPTAAHPPGAVVSTVRVGYRTKERVLRAAQVVVAREAEQAAKDR